MVEPVNPKDKVGRTKLPLWLLPAAGLIHATLALVDGAVKYGPYNWRRKPISATEYISAIKRHIADYESGEDVAADSKVKHLGCIMATCDIMLDAEAHGTLIDDRAKGVAVSELLEDVRQHPMMLLLQEKGYAKLPEDTCQIQAQRMEEKLLKRILEPEFSSYPPKNSN